MPREGDYVTVPKEEDHAAYRVVGIVLTEGCTSPGIDLFVAEGRPFDEVGAHIKPSQSPGTAESGGAASRQNAARMANPRSASANRKSMTKMMVYVADEDDRCLDLREFPFMPREGNYVAMRDERGPAAYRVVAIRPREGTSARIDLFVAGRRPSSDIYGYIRRSWKYEQALD